MSERFHDAPALLRSSAPESGDGDFRRSAPAQEPARPRTFDAYMGQQQASGSTRLQDLRAKHGWSLFRSSKSAGGRAYADALKAEKWRFLGGARVAEREGPLSDSALAAKYRTGKQALKAGAGWRRFLPFSSTRSTYKDALSRFRSGKLQHENSLTSWDKLMGTKAAQRVMHPDRGSSDQNARPDADLQEVQALLGSGDPPMVAGGAAGDAAAKSDARASTHSSIGFDELLNSKGIDPGIGEQEQEQHSQDDDAADAENEARIQEAWDKVSGTDAFKQFMFNMSGPQEKPE